MTAHSYITFSNSGFGVELSVRQELREGARPSGHNPAQVTTTHSGGAAWAFQPECTATSPAPYDLVWSCSTVNTPYNHALALFQSRLTRTGVIPRTSAVSSTLNPPK